MDWASLLVGMQQSQNQRQVLAPIATEAPVSPWAIAVFGVGAIAVVAILASALREP